MFNITVDEMHRVDVIVAEGHINSETATELAKTLADRHSKGRHNLVVDLEKVTYMSSAGLRALIEGFKRSRDAGGGLALAAPSERVREVLDLSGLTELFPIYDERVSAVGSF